MSTAQQKTSRLTGNGFSGDFRLYHTAAYEHVSPIEHGGLTRRHRPLGLPEANQRSIAMGMQRSRGFFRLVADLYRYLRRLIRKYSQRIIYL